VLGAQHVDEPRRERLGHGHAVGLGAQGGHELEEAPVVGHVEVVERDVVDRHARRHVEARLARAQERGERRGRRHLIGVEPRARHLQEREIAIEAHALGHRAHVRQAAQGGEGAGGGRGARGQVRVLDVAHHERAEALRVGHGAGHHAGVAHRARPVAEGHGARVAEKADLGHLAPLAALGQGRHGMRADGALAGRAAGNELQRLRAVHRGVGVGARDDGGDAPGGGGGARAPEALLVALARLADLDAPVHDPGREVAAAALDHLVERPLGLGRQEPRDEAALHDEAARRLGPFRVHEADVADQDSCHGTPLAAPCIDRAAHGGNRATGRALDLEHSANR
jgi:hypothetical protein